MRNPRSSFPAESIAGLSAGLVSYLFVEGIDLVAIAFFDGFAAKLQCGRERAIIGAKFIGHEENFF